jgi:hypothetical protein
MSFYRCLLLLANHDLVFTSIELALPRTLRAYVLLARQADNTERWTRVGIAVITLYDVQMSFRGYPPDRRPDMFWQEDSRETAEMILEPTMRNNRTFLRLFDEAESQDVTIW